MVPQKLLERYKLGSTPRWPLDSPILRMYEAIHIQSNCRVLLKRYDISSVPDKAQVQQAAHQLCTMPVWNPELLAHTWYPARFQSQVVLLLYLSVNAQLPLCSSLIYRMFEVLARSYGPLHSESLFNTLAVHTTPETLVFVHEWAVPLEEITKEPMPPPICAYVAQTLLKAVTHVSSHQDYWGAIRARKVMLTEEGLIKLDFCPVQHSMENDAQMMCNWGPQAMQEEVIFMLAPESIRGEPLSVRSEVYAIGIFMIRLLTGSYPFCSNETPMSTLVHVMSGPRIPAPSETVSDLFLDWATGCTAQDPKQRLGLKEAQHHMWLCETACAESEFIDWFKDVVHF